MNNKYSVIKEGVVLVDYGPVTMTLEARKNHLPYTDAAVHGAQKALEAFDVIAKHLDFLRQPVGEIEQIPSDLPLPVRKMADSVKMLEEGDFTSMAAVAGTISDFAAKSMQEYGASYAIANNGGDIAFQVAQDEAESLRVGLISNINNGHVTHVLKINSLDKIRGLATSGLGGRSLTRGIASAVTVLSSDSSRADAAATAIANACICDDPAIYQCPAREIDYGTDIPDLLVTKAVGELQPGSVEKALRRGSDRARELLEKGMILGAVVFVFDAMSIIEKCVQGEHLFQVTQLQ